VSDLDSHGLLGAEIRASAYQFGITPGVSSVDDTMPPTSAKATESMTISDTGM
jgi:hypothetical protein